MVWAVSTANRQKKKKNKKERKSIVRTGLKFSASATPYNTEFYKENCSLVPASDAGDKDFFRAVSHTSCRTELFPIL